MEGWKDKSIAIDINESWGFSSSNTQLFGFLEDDMTVWSHRYCHSAANTFHRMQKSKYSTMVNSVTKSGAFDKSGEFSLVSCKALP